MNPRPSVSHGTTPRIGLVSWRVPASGTSLFTLASEAELDGVQFDFGGPGRAAWLDAPGNVAALRLQASDSGVDLLAVAGNSLNDTGLHAPDGTAAAAEVRSLIERMLDTAAALGCPLVFVPSFRRSAIEGPEALQRTAEVLSWASRAAADRGLTLASENTLQPPDALALIKQVNAANFRLLLDVYNLPRAGVDATDFIAALAPYLADQIHLKDGVAGDTSAALGTGDGDIESALEELARQSVSPRFLVLENDYRDGDPRRLRADVAWARRWAERLREPRSGAGHE